MHLEPAARAQGLGAAPMEDPNKHAIDFLHNYTSPSSPFDYAVMITGPWGSGKTYLIKEFLDQRRKAGFTKDLYVSLYGMTSTRQIDDAFFRQLHPVLSSKGMKIAAEIAKGTLKTALKVD